ncbi:MAG: hypothetical protein JJV98_21570 [Desulfosarcina sp.]|nr:hypothetical protein [Desulfobacterales bacterium]
MPFFLEVTSISTSPSFSVSSNMSTNIQKGRNSYNYKMFDLQYTERPTITYTPLGGERFAHKLMTPVNLQTISLLYQAGWDLDRILRICVQSINGIPNAEEAAGPTPAKPPQYKKFQRIARTLKRLDQDGYLSIGRSDGEEKVRVQLAIDPRIRNDEDVIRFFEDLGLDPKAPYYLLTNAVSGGGRTLAIATRPITGTMFYLSQSIEVPDKDVRNEVVTITRLEDKQTFNWDAVTRDLIRIQSSGTRPGDAFIAVPFRNAWFYIADNDRESRKTFALLSLLLTLQAGEIPQTGPILTLPVGVGG